VEQSLASKQRIQGSQHIVQRILHDEATEGAVRSQRLADLDPQFAGGNLDGASVTLYASLEECEGVYRQAVTDCTCFAFQTFEFLSAWSNTVGKAQNVSEHIVHVTDRAGRTLLILPLAIHREKLLRTLRFLGGDLTDYNAPVIDAAFARGIRPGDFSRLWNVVLALLPGFDAVWLRRMPPTVEDVPNPMLELRGTEVTDHAHAVVLPASFAEYSAPRSSQFFAKNRQYRRKLARTGSLVFSMPEDTTERRRILQAMMRHKSHWLLETGLPDQYTFPGYPAFYERLTDTPMQEGSVFVSALLLDNESIGFVWGMVFRGRFYVLVTTHDAKWRPLSAGRLAVESVLQWCIDAPDIRIFDMTIGDENYKQRWTDQPLALSEYISFRTPTGAAFVAARRLRNVLRKNDRARAVFEKARALSERAKALFKPAAKG
jgi:CelD/BcsL family acetyltransferase involved in cellulose biosynthesis